MLGIPASLTVENTTPYIISPRRPALECIGLRRGADIRRKKPHRIKKNRQNKKRGAKPLACRLAKLVRDQTSYWSQKQEKIVSYDRD